MTKTLKKTRRVLEVLEPIHDPVEQAHTETTTTNPVVMTDVFGNAYTAQDLAPRAPAAKTVVKTAYKHRYQDRAKARGLTDKASRRGNGDWLQREVQAETIGKDGKFDLAKFEAILDANGVDYSRWNRTSNGWQGRVRMERPARTARRGLASFLALLRTPDGETNVVELAEHGDEDAAAFLAKWAN